MNMKSNFIKMGKPKFSMTSKIMPQPRRVLDIGMANDSYREFKAIFPTAIYDGLDYVDSGVIMEPGDRFLICDLESDNCLDDLNHVYDLIIINHVLEHLKNGHKIFADLCALLAPGGVLYAEFPSIRTALKRKTRNSYHFHDDPTHKTFYQLEGLANIAIASGCTVVSCGPISTPLKDILSLPRALLGWMRGLGYGPFLLHLLRKIDHMMVSRPH